MKFNPMHIVRPKVPILLAKPPKLGLEILLAMMVRLAANIRPHSLDVHWADTEFAITGLPREIRIPCVLFLDPTGGRTLNLLDDFGGGVILGLCEENVNVVGHRVDFDQGRIVVFENAGNIGVKVAALGVPKQLASDFCAEHEVNDYVGEGLRHGGDALTGLEIIVQTVCLGLHSSDSFQPSYHISGLRPWPKGGMYA